MAFDEAAASVLEASRKLRIGRAANEANTKALLIEPMLSALGWALSDLDQIEREVKVFEGTFLDYALKLDGTPRVYVEAKGISEKLDDKKFVAQTINYANNDGVLWCVLTNGLRYRVYKTNEPAAMDQKLLFEVDLADDAAPFGEKARLLQLIGRKAVEEGALDRFGEAVFADARVRKALAELAASPPEPFVSAIVERLGHPGIAPRLLRESLARVLDATIPPDRPTSSKGSKRPGPVSGPSQPPRRLEYTLDHHLGSKSTLIRELWEEIDGHASTLGADVSRRVRKQYIGYFRGKRSFFTAEIQQRRVLLFLSLPTSVVKEWNAPAMRDVSTIGHFGMGDVEFSIVTLDQLVDARELISLAYDSRS